MALAPNKIYIKKHILDQAQSYRQQLRTISKMTFREISKWTVLLNAMLIYPKHVVLSPDISLRCHSCFTFPVLTRRDYRNAALTLLRPAVRGKIDLKNISTLLICRVYCRKAAERICYYTTTFYWVLFHLRVLNSFSDSTSNLYKLALRTQLVMQLLCAYEAWLQETLSINVPPRQTKRHLRAVNPPETTKRAFIPVLSFTFFFFFRSVSCIRWGCCGLWSLAVIKGGYHVLRAR